jgi:hypothetical protein
MADPVKQLADELQRPIRQSKLDSRSNSRYIDALREADCNDIAACKAL